MKSSDLKQGDAFRVKNGKNIYRTDYVGSSRVTATLLCRHSEDAVLELELGPDDEVISVSARKHITHDGWRRIQV